MTFCSIFGVLETPFLLTIYVNDRASLNVKIGKNLKRDMKKQALFRSTENGTGK